MSYNNFLNYFKSFAENGFESKEHQPKNSALQSPQRHHFLYDQPPQSDSRLPPDLLPYGQQSLQQSTAAAILESGQYTPYDDTLFYKDSGSSTTTSTVPSTAQLHHRRNSSQDLHIYKDCISNSITGASSRTADLNGSISSGGGPGSGSSYGGSTTSSGVGLGVGQKQPQHQTLPHRTSNYPLHVQFSNSNNSKVETPCKPRQSIVRTSPSFSFLSTGCQQPNNFLW